MPAQDEALRQLPAKVADAAKAPPAVPVSAPPEIAASVSGKRSTFPLNPSRLDSLSLTFRDNSEARLEVKYLGEDLSFPVGLDGVYRLGPHGPLHLLAGAMGKWTAENEFLLDLNLVANINPLHAEDPFRRRPDGGHRRRGVRPDSQRAHHRKVIGSGQGWGQAGSATGRSPHRPTRAPRPASRCDDRVRRAGLPRRRDTWAAGSSESGSPASCRRS